MDKVNLGLQLVSKFFSTPVTAPENVTADSVLSALGTLVKDKKETEKWIKFLVADLIPVVDQKDNKLSGKLHKLNKDLLTSVFFLDTPTPSVVDLLFFPLVHSLVQGWTDVDRSSFNNITRWFDYVQHYEGVYGALPSLSLLKVKKELVEAPKQETKPSAPSTEKKQEDKQQQQQAPKQDKKEATTATPGAAKPAPKKAEKQEEKVDVSRLDIRVGKIVSVKIHEQADSLYVEEIDVGEDKPRTVVSGLRKFVPIEEMQNRLVVVLCNLKPSKLKGILSEAMVLAASDEIHTQVELVCPPEGSKPGERVTFNGYPGDADAQLNPKKQVWETVCPDLSTTGECVAVYKAVPFTTSAGICKVKSIANGKIK